MAYEKETYGWNAVSYTHLDVYKRQDLYYNSRANQETVDGLFYMYPLDKRLDANGKDMNATANGSFYPFYTRIGVDVTGPKLGKRCV